MARKLPVPPTFFPACLRSPAEMPEVMSRLVASSRPTSIPLGVEPTEARPT